ncbi:MAG: invasion associated locus B family protein [Paracoccaceae bacterium]|nr:invasion associated locus B family protein [Paracoccaceae bacterium]
MFRKIFALGVALAVFQFSESDAQTTQADRPSPPALSMGTAENAPQRGNPYIATIIGRWERHCIRTAQNQDPCQLYQLLKDKNGNAVSEINLFRLPPGGKAVAGATIIVPLETLLTKQLKIRVDENPAQFYPFSFCSSVGCVARIGLTQDDIQGFKSGSLARVSLVPVAAPEQLVILNMSLDGFIASFDALIPLQN